MKRFFSSGRVKISLVLVMFLLGLVGLGWWNRNRVVGEVRASSSIQDLNFVIEKVLGQPDEKETMTNLITPDRGMHLGGVHVDGLGRVYAFDSGNNRILGFSSYSVDRPADIVIGQTGLDAKGTSNGDNTKYNNPTASTLSLIPYPLVNSTLEAPREGQMSSDSQGNLYVVDLNNNRVLKYIDPFGTDQVADEVWGQPDFGSRTNYCGSGGRTPSSTTFCTEYGTEFSGTEGIQVFMSGVKIDSSGNMWVADTGNNRVMRFPSSGGVIAKTADLVLGQADFGSRTGRDPFDGRLDKFIKPVALEFDPENGNLYVLEGEFAGQARVVVFSPPFSTGMNGSLEFGRATWQDSQPTDTSGWANIAGKWVRVASGLYWPRGLVFDSQSSGVWVNDGSNNRMAFFTRQGVLTQVIGQPDLNTVGCLGRQDQGFVNLSGGRQNLCDPAGGIGVSSDSYMYVSMNANADERSIVRFKLPIQRNQSGLAISDGRLLHAGWNKFSGKTFFNGYGTSMVMSGTSNTTVSQLVATDRQRLLVWNDPDQASNFSQANFVVGQDAFDTNTNNNGGIFSGIDLGPSTVGAGHLWVSAYDRIFAIALPINASGKNYPVVKTLYTGAYQAGNVVWSDDLNTKVRFRANGLAFDPTAEALWVSDSENNRVLRIKNPLSTATVDLVLGQPNKSSVSDNAGQTRGGNGFGDPWYLKFDRLGNLYVVDAKFEGGVNNRVLRFSAGDLQVDPGNIFKFVSASGVYTKPAFDSSSNSSQAGMPSVPTFVDFDSQNRMLLFTESYYNKQYQRVYLYGSGHSQQVAPQPSYRLGIPAGQTATGGFYEDDNHFILQDHTWNRMLFVRFEYPPEPTATSVLPTPTTAVPTPTPQPQSIEVSSSDYMLTYDGWRGVSDSRAEGGWLRANANRGGYLIYNSTAPSSSLSILTYKGPDQGKMSITIDGVTRPVVDLYSPTPVFGHKINISGLSNTTHKVRIAVSGNKNKLSTSTEVRFDGLELPSGIVSDNNPMIQLGRWIPEASVGSTDGYHYRSAAAGAKVTFTTEVNSFYFVSKAGTCCGGQFEVFIDGLSEGVFDFYDPNFKIDTWRWESNDLTSGLHTVDVVVKGSRSLGRSNNVYVDGFVIIRL